MFIRWWCNICLITEIWPILFDSSNIEHHVREYKMSSLNLESSMNTLIIFRCSDIVCLWCAVFQLYHGVNKFNRGEVVVFNATFNNISVIKWPSVLLVEETRIHWENHRQAWSHWQAYHIILYRIHLVWTGLELATLVVIGTDCIGSYESNYHMITTMTAPWKNST